ncbi:MAG: SipW-dependent-type signal peptide-containing protein [Eubacteriales bacterium]|nr:SipW-dependent-type signal peptide-containing protein [Eubacteriales bacterium]
MNESTKTKKALRGSLFALFLCIVLLIGTTFAWFTDTASTGVNKIQSGRLDVSLEKFDTAQNKWVSAENDTLTFKTADNRTADEILWEPGCTYELPELRVVNNGNLALKYKLKINGIQGDEELNKVIDWTYSVSGAGGDAVASLDTERHLAAKTGDNDVFDTLTIKGHMQESAGNEYKDKSINGISITVVATQDTVENDSFGNTYDANAVYPVVADNQEEVNDAITNATGGAVAITVPANKTITLDNDIANAGEKSRDITFIGNGTQKVDVVKKAVAAEGGQLNYQRGSSFTFENLTIQAGEGSFDGIVCDELTYKNCTIKGKLTLYGKATFVNCIFENDMDNQYSIWTWGGTDVTFKGCKFNTNGKAILLYGQATAAKPTNLVVNNCTFNDRNNGAAGKAAVEIGNDYNATYKLTINKAIVNGFADGKNTGSKLWANKNSMDAAHLTVTIDGKKIQ